MWQTFFHLSLVWPTFTVCYAATVPVLFGLFRVLTILFITERQS